MVKDLAASLATAGTLTTGIFKELKERKVLGAFPLTYSATSTVRGKGRCHIWVVDFSESEAVDWRNVLSVPCFLLYTSELKRHSTPGRIEWDDL